MDPIPEPPGSPIRIVGQQRRDEKQREKHRIEEDATQLLGSSCSVLDHRKACRTGRAKVVHRNLEVPALTVGVRAGEPKALTTAPRDLECDHGNR